MKTEFTGYWTFFCNPDKWEIDRFLETEPMYDIYQIMPWQAHFFSNGQLGVIRVGVDNRSKKKLAGKPKLQPGIYAIVEIISDACKRVENPDKFWDLEKWNEKELSKPVVKLKYLKNMLAKPLLFSNKNIADIASQDNYLFKGFQASAMPLLRETFNNIVGVDKDSEIWSNCLVEHANTTNQIHTLNEKYRNSTPEVKEYLAKRIERGSIASEIKKLYGYKCLVCEAQGNNPFSFIKTNSEHYVETHHINYVSNLEMGSLGLSNLITLCANHHRQFHYGNVIIEENSEEKLNVLIDGKNIEIKKMQL